MSTFVIHLLIPPLMVLAVRVFPFRYVWAWVWVSVIPDLDYAGWILYVNGWVGVNVHRALFHNAFILAALVFFAARGYRRFRRANPGAVVNSLSSYAQTRGGSGWLLSSYYYFSHLLLDTFQGGFAPLFPLGLAVPRLDFTLFYYFVFDVDTRTHKPIVEAQGGTQPGVVDVSPVYQWLSSEEFAFCLLLTTSLLLGYLYRRFGHRVRILNARRVGAPAEPGRGPVPPDDPQMQA